MRVRTLIVGAVFLVTLSCARGGIFGGDDSGNVVTGGEAYRAYVDEIATGLQCSILAQCPPPQTEGALYIDASQPVVCKTLMKRLLRDNGSLAGLYTAFSKGHASLDLAKMRACANEILKGDCTEVWRKFRWEPPEQCLEMLKGTLQEGMDCQSSYECAPGLYCDGCPGTCKPQKGEGEACGDDLECSPPLRCIGNVCSTPSFAKEGESCDKVLGPFCGYGYSCARGDSGRVCTRLKGAGQQCDPDRDLLCSPGMGCDPQSGVCVPTTIQGEGQECDGYTLLCDPQAQLVCYNGACLRMPGDGEPCINGEFCWFGATCDASGTCHDTVEFGGECSSDTDCSHASCQDSVCTPDPCE